MGLLISITARIITILRIVISIILGSLGISTILAAVSQFIFEPSTADLKTLLIWIAKPVIIGALFIFIAYLISKNLSRTQKVIIVVLVVVFSLTLFMLLVNTMSWFSQSMASDLGVFSAPVDMLRDINNMSGGLTGL
jgi:uncharacterized membrane protein